MTLKKTDLARRLELKIEGQRKNAAIPQRFAGAEPLDKRERRKADAAAGLVPFACKLPSTLAAELREKAQSHPDGLNGLVAGLLQDALLRKA